MSEQVMTQTRAQTTQAKPASGLLQRVAITPVAHGALQRCSNGVECPECRAKREQQEGTLQRAAVNAAPTPAVPPIVHDVLSSPGQPLDAGVRAFMEPRFGHDFSSVRVHTDARAAESARAVNALAYTVGRNVVFGAGQYMPETMAGKKLLAHKLTHVVQRSQYQPLNNPTDISDPQDVSEKEAIWQSLRVMDKSRIDNIFIPQQVIQAILQREKDENSGDEQSGEKMRTIDPTTTYEKELKIAEVEKDFKFVGVKAELLAKIHGSIEPEGASSEVTISKESIGMEISKELKTSYGDITLSVGGETGESKKLALGVEVGGIKGEIGFNPKEPFTLEVPIEKKEVEYELGKGLGKLKGHLDLIVEIKVFPTHLGILAAAKRIIKVGRLVRGAFVTDIGTSTTAGVVSIAVTAGLAYIAVVAFGLYKMSEALYEGNNQTIGEVFANGYAEMLSLLTSDNLGGLGKDVAAKLLQMTNWKEEFVKASEQYQKFGAGVAQAQALDAIKQTGRAAILIDVDNYLKQYGYDSWKLFSEHEQEVHFKDRNKRREKYKEILYEQVKKKETIGIPFSVSEEATGNEKKGTLQRTAVNAAPTPAVPPIVHDVLSSPGQPLDASTRAFMEPRFGHDFSGVRVHTNAKAAESAQAVNALAYTVGNNVVFGAGQHMPETMAGKQLLAHELTHVVQQGGIVSRPQAINEVHDNYEKEADSMASNIMQGRERTINTKSTSAALQRQNDDTNRFQLRMPSREKQVSLFPPGQEPRLHLDLATLRPLLNMQGVTRLRPIGIPKWQPTPSTVSGPMSPGWLPTPGSTSTVSDPKIPKVDDPSKIVDLDFNLDIEPISLAAYTLARLGQPLQTPAEQSQQQFEQLYAQFSGRDMDNTPLGIQLLGAGINLLANTDIVSHAIDKAHLSNVTFILNPATKTYGATIQIVIPPKFPF